MKTFFIKYWGLILFILGAIIMNIFGLSYELKEGKGLTQLSEVYGNIAFISFFVLMFIKGKSRYSVNMNRSKFIEITINSFVILPLTLTGIFSFVEMLHSKNVEPQNIQLLFLILCVSLMSFLMSLERDRELKGKN